MIQKLFFIAFWKHLEETRWFQDGGLQDGHCRRGQFCFRRSTKTSKFAQKTSRLKKLKEKTKVFFKKPSKI
jgi:hypothetical protein